MHKKSKYNKLRLLISHKLLILQENKGRFYHKFIPTIWKSYDSNLHEWMLKLTEAFDLTFPIPEDGEQINIVPCLLPEKEPKNVRFKKINLWKR